MWTVFWTFFTPSPASSLYVVIWIFDHPPPLRSSIKESSRYTFHYRYHITNRLAAPANENGPVTGGCPISSMVTVNIHGQHLYRELNLYYWQVTIWLSHQVDVSENDLSTKNDYFIFHQKIDSMSVQCLYVILYQATPKSQTSIGNRYVHRY